MPETEVVVGALVDGHREFLAFVERRLGDRAAAEDLLQEAFVRSLSKVDELRDPDAARAWFYRMLRNAIVDRHRRATVERTRLAAFADELAQAESMRDAVDAQVCACVGRLLTTLKPEFAAALQRIDLDGVAVKAFAAEAGISESNAGVRVFRARRALRERVARACGSCAEHGCLDCTCGGDR